MFPPAPGHPSSALSKDVIIFPVRSGWPFFSVVASSLYITGEWRAGATPNICSEVYNRQVVELGGLST